MSTVLERSDDYDAFVSRLRATGKFKSIFGDFGAINAHPNMTMTNYMTTKERAEYPRDLYKTLIGIAQNGRKPAGLTAAISDLLGKENPSLSFVGDATHTTLLVPPRSVANTEGTKCDYSHSRRSRAAGKPAKVALTATMRKLLIVLNSAL
jgi:hypothetical protein